MKMKLRTSIVLLCFMLALIGTIAHTYINFQTTNEVLTEEVYEHLETTTQSRAHHIEHFIEEQKNKILIAATHQELSNEELKEIRDTNREYTQMCVLNSNGKIIACSEESQIGKDKSNDDYFIEGKNGVHITGIYFSKTLGDIALAVSAPQGEGNVLVARIDINILNEITTDRTGLGKTGETYLINKESLLLTPSRFMINNILVQEVNTVNAQNCINELGGNTTEHTGHNAITSFLDYRGELVLGAHHYISGIEWCLLVEIEEAEVLGIVKEKLLQKFIISVVIILLLVFLISFFVGGYLEKIYLKKKMKGNISKFGKILSKIKLKYFLIFALIFTIGCFFLITSFFQGWQNAAFYDDIPDLLALMAFVSLLFFSFHLKNIHAKKFIFIGALFSIIDRISQIILEEYIFAFGLISEIYWIPGAILGFIGLIIIFLGFAEVVK